MQATTVSASGRAVEQHVTARDHVDTGGHHRRRVDQRGDRRGALHCVGQPDVERNLRGLACRAQHQQQRDGSEELRALPLRMLRDGAEDLRKAQAAEVRDQQEHCQQETEVADAVDDEGLFAGVGGGGLLEVKADQQVRAEAHALPADEQQQEVCGQHQHRHEEHEEVEVGEEAPVALFVAHVADRVDVDEEADAGDHGEHDQREVIDGEGEVGVEAGDGDPFMSVGTKHRLDCGGCARGTHRHPQPRDEGGGQRGEEQRHCADDGARQPSPQRPVDQEAGEGKQRNEPEIACGHGVHDFIRSISLTFSVWRVRKMERMMARPTAASAAATTITKKTKICPLT